MAVPSPVKFTKDGVEYISNVDRTKYTLNELLRAALKDCGKLICKETRKNITRRTGRVAKNTQYWVRKKDCDLQVGFKAGGFYGIFQEIGTKKQKKVGALSRGTKENIDEIQKIQAMYLSAIEDEQKALSMIDESEGEGE